MGTSHSKTALDEKVFYNDTPIQFSQDVVNHLSDKLASPTTSPQRQSTLDAHIRSRIQAELEHMRGEEEHVRREIEQALEKENLDRDVRMAGALGNNTVDDQNASGDVRSSVALLGDLDEIRRKVDRFQSRRQLTQFPAVKANAEAVVSCYKANGRTPLKCWREVSDFKDTVAQLEQQYFSSLR